MYYSLENPPIRFSCHFLSEKFNRLNVDQTRLKWTNAILDVMFNLKLTLMLSRKSDIPLINPLPDNMKYHAILTVLSNARRKMLPKATPWPETWRELILKYLLPLWAFETTWYTESFKTICRLTDYDGF